MDRTKQLRKFSDSANNNYTAKELRKIADGSEYKDPSQLQNAAKEGKHYLKINMDEFGPEEVPNLFGKGTHLEYKGVSGDSLSMVMNEFRARGFNKAKVE